MTYLEQRVLERADPNCQTHRVVTEGDAPWFLPLVGRSTGRRRIPIRAWRRLRLKRWVMRWASFKGSDTTYWQISAEGRAALFAEQHP